jgi:hypothetical protein
MFAVFGVLLSICLPLDVPGMPCDASLSVGVQRFPDQFVFTARVVLVGRSFGLLPGHSYWSVARVQRRFPGLPSPTSDFVIFRWFFKPGERGEYFVDGRRGPGLLGRLLPIVEVYPCCRTQPLDRAALELRVLQGGPPKSGVRIVGRVVNAFPTSEPARGVKMLITGPAGSVTTTTDQQGIYDLTGLPAGHYSIQVESESERQRGLECDVKSGEVLQSTLTAPLAQP